ncbi:uncharacterized protein LOC131941854 [Physella acuta]|uniref:uncharacterized protein LOC131941854 n=1 Tax=Physella acuta TaxID=109671 RepID=UPI0027DD130E|nr:uncharacterized protein LOC131941854 [Physella acuta]
MGSVNAHLGTSAKTLKYWSGVQCQTRGLFGQCRTGGLAVTKQALKPGLSNPFWVPSAGYCDYPDDIILDSKITNGIHPGTTVIIRGKPSPCCKQFTVSLDNGRKEMSNVPFNMTAYFKEQKEANNVVLNSKKKGVVDYSNEKTISTKIPFEINKDIKITVQPEEKVFKVLVNDRSFDFLPHTIKDFNKLRHVKVYGGFKVTEYQITEPNPHSYRPK